MKELNLFMVLLGCKPANRNIEQHDIYFGIAHELKELGPEIIHCWPEAIRNIHIDAWRAVKNVNGYAVQVLPKKDPLLKNEGTEKLYFINLGGYKAAEFEEFHYKMLLVAKDKAAAVLQSKETAFYKHTGFVGAPSHIDDKYGIDVDDIFEITDILPKFCREQYGVLLTPVIHSPADDFNLGYTRLEKLLKR